MDYNFEEFKEVGGRFKPIISLGTRSDFGLSSGFTNAYDLKGVVGVKMFYDSAKKAVGFKFLTTKEDGMANVVLRPKGGYISAQSFIGKFKIDQAKYAGRYEPVEINDSVRGKIYVIELKETQNPKN